jgi:hypothetical protein
MNTRITPTLGALAICLALIICLALVGCAAPKATEGPASVVGTAKDNASIVTCRTNRAQLEQQYSIVLSGGSEGSTDFGALVKELGVKCPSNGVYSWDAPATKVKCSVHGE